MASLLVRREQQRRTVPGGRRRNAQRTTTPPRCRQVREPRPTHAARSGATDRWPARAGGRNTRMTHKHQYGASPLPWCQRLLESQNIGARRRSPRRSDRNQLLQPSRPVTDARDRRRGCSTSLIFAQMFSGNHGEKTSNAPCPSHTAGILWVSQQHLHSHPCRAGGSAPAWPGARLGLTPQRDAPFLAVFRSLRSSRNHASMPDAKRSASSGPSCSIAVSGRRGVTEETRQDGGRRILDLRRHGRRR